MKENLTADEYKAARQSIAENDNIAYIERQKRVKADMLARPEYYANLNGKVAILPETNLADSILPAGKLDPFHEELLITAQFSAITDKQAPKQIYFKGTNQVKQSPPPEPPADVLNSPPAIIESVKHVDVLKDILEKFTAGSYTDKPADLKITDSVKQLAVIYQLLEITEKHDFKICQNNQAIYIYNGCYWKKYDPEQFANFLGDCAVKSGITKWIADDYLFKQNLYKQFLSNAYLNKPEIDPNKVIINLQNSTFEINAGITSSRTFDPADFLTYQLNFSYDPNATAPKFFEYLNYVLPDQSCQQVIAEYLGYIFIRHGAKILKEEMVLFLYGTGQNGKSVLFELITMLLGKDNVSNYELSELTDDTGYYRAMIGDKLLNYGSDINTKLKHATFKKLVSGESLIVRLPHQKPMELDQYAKLIFNCNTLPKDTEQTDGFFRRFLIIPFEVKIPDEKKNTSLHSEIAKDELAGIFNWILQGLERLLKNQKFTYCEPAEKTLSKYKLDSDSVLQFIDDNNWNHKSNHFTPLAELYKEYKNYCLDSGCNPLNKTNFSSRLQKLGSKHKRGTGGVVMLNVTKKLFSDFSDFSSDSTDSSTTQ